MREDCYPLQSSNATLTFLVAMDALALLHLFSLGNGRERDTSKVSGLIAFQLSLEYRNVTCDLQLFAAGHSVFQLHVPGNQGELGDATKTNWEKQTPEAWTFNTTSTVRT